MQKIVVKGLTDDFKIASREDMEEFRKMINENRKFKGKKVELVKSIGLLLDSKTDIWQPINLQNFEGTFLRK